MFQNASPYTKIMVLLLDPVNSIQWQSSEIPEIDYKHSTLLSYHLTMKATICKAESYHGRIQDVKLEMWQENLNQVMQFFISLF